MSAPDTTTLPDGWIPHDGGECPVPDDVRVIVDIQPPLSGSPRCGKAWQTASYWHWPNEGAKLRNIVAYRIHPDDQHLVDAAKGKSDPPNPPLTIEVGKTYVDMDGKAMRIIADDAEGDEEYPFVGRCKYGGEGLFRFKRSGECRDGAFPLTGEAPPIFWLVFGVDSIAGDFETCAEAAAFADDQRGKDRACVIRRIEFTPTLDGSTDDE